MKNWIASHHQIVFFTAWLLLAIWQSSNTELLDDEALYWVYSRFPAWGYFEHPPMVSFLAGAGYSIIPNETGLRSLFLILNTGSLFLLQSLTNKKDPLLFYAIIASISLLHLASHLAVPDSPLVFASVCFLLFFKRFLVKASLLNCFLLALSIATAFYSKYHAFLLVLFSFAANPALLSRSRTWLVFLMVLVSMIPHIYWLYENGSAGIIHHLQERHIEAWRPSFTLQFIQAQLLTSGPLTGWLLLFAGFRIRTHNDFSRTLKWLMAAVFIFFLSLSFFVRVESNWTVLAFLPMILLSHAFLQTQTVFRRWLFIALPFSLLIIFIQRAAIISDNLFLQRLGRNELHYNKVFAERFRASAANSNNSVVFINSYQQASKYYFYAGIPSFSLNTVAQFRNSFNQWPLEAAMIGKTVFVVDSSVNKKAEFREIENYFSFSGIYFTVKDMRRVGGIVELLCKQHINEALIPFIGQQNFSALGIYLAAYDGKGKLIAILPTTTKIGHLKAGYDQLIIKCEQPLPITAEKYRIAIETAINETYTCNSHYFSIR